MRKLLLIGLAALSLAGCQQHASRRPVVTSAAVFNAPAEPGETKIRFKQINRDKWLPVRGIRNGASMRQIHLCKPLACAGYSSMETVVSPSPTRNPDPKALVNMGQLQLAKWLNAPTANAIVTNGKTLSPARVEKFRGFSSVTMAARRDKNGKTEFMIGRHILAGASHVTFWSVSQDEGAARTNLAEFLNNLEIKDGGAAQPAHTAEAQTAPEQD